MALLMRLCAPLQQSADSDPPGGWTPGPAAVPQDGQGGTPAKPPTVEEIKQGRTTHGGEPVPAESPEQETYSGGRTGNS